MVRKRGGKAAPKDPRQVEMFVTRASAARVVEDEEERVMVRLEEIEEGMTTSWDDDSVSSPALDLERVMLHECARRLREVRSRIEQLVG